MFSCYKIQKLLSDIAFKSKNNKKAFEQYEQALRLLDIHKKSQYKSNIECLNAIAETEIHNGNYTEALLYLKQSLEIRNKIYLPAQLEIARTFQQIGLVHMKFNIYEETAIFREWIKNI
ncbi:hypothetical protein I4U23_006058 [Adineta vaga]|nr:hypothetical protein I4U23_006058 [Adineta vaga]